MAKKKKSKKKPLKIMVAHDNKTPGHTTKAHKFSERLDKDSKYKTIHDQKKWKKGEKTSPTETNEREKQMVKDADVVVRIVPPSSKTGEKRHEGAKREIRKAIRQQKPIIEIFEKGARNSPNRNISEKNYKKKTEVHLKPKENLETGFKQGIKDLNKKGLKLGRKSSKSRIKSSPSKTKNIENKKSKSRKSKNIKKSSNKSRQKKPSNKKRSSKSRIKSSPSKTKNIENKKSKSSKSKNIKKSSNKSRQKKPSNNKRSSKSIKKSSRFKTKIITNKKSKSTNSKNIKKNSNKTTQNKPSKRKRSSKTRKK
ncbi:hypothetical protein DSAG12_02664 [Promethearchaeum syntrophicum]|uniref:Uncharacterized protein n=1 Tax=Promethearchaeum syntrophicum TaxID=2594042 RepID=A0A5B9DCC7_9ARCH|nr:hypothetical protein [Candidatus Prometheoarchaeum syntrophicum]QEE16834.1 hypothetical protein DSAG12_02664 [Candidatus Prometheoarchaeum syntrophicum]